MKQYENSTNDYIPPEVSNEIKYALRALIEIVELEADNDKKEELKHAEEKVHHALLCAYHDLVDGLAIHLTDMMSTLTKDYLKESVQVLGNRRLDIIDFTNEVNNTISQSRETNKNRIKVYDEILYDGYFPKLLEYRNLLNREVSAISTLSEKAKQKDIIMVVIAIVGVIVGVVGTVN